MLLKIFKQYYHIRNIFFVIGEGLVIYFSFILDVTYERGFENCEDPRHFSYTPEQYQQRYERFYNEEKFTEFTLKAEIPADTFIDANSKNWDEFAEHIIEIINRA